jgi:predicted polyphosphate/ATP-dependent NAD kinase
MRSTDPIPAKKCSIGLVVNPIAGMGGAVGLKGTDGALVDQAARAGAVARACSRAARAIEVLTELGDSIQIVTSDGAMGGDAVESAGMTPAVVHHAAGRDRSSARDTVEAAGRMADLDVDLLLFAGGDGTARDIIEAVGDRVPVLGIPAGVKMHSSVFAASPRAAGEVARRFLSSTDPSAMLEQAEVLDRDENVDSDAPVLCGSLTIPRLDQLVPGAKASSRLSNRAALDGALDRTRQLIDDDRINLLGPGSTMRSLKLALGFEGTLLGVDAIRRGQVLGTDLGERDILELIGGKPARIVMTVIGGQGFLFGRGNQPLSPAVIREVGLDNIVVVASQEKLVGLPGNCLLVDTGDTQLDEELSGYLPVLVSSRRSVMMPVRQTSTETVS